MKPFFLPVLLVALLAALPSSAADFRTGADAYDNGDYATLWRAKNSDTFKPMGPWIETDVDLEKLQTNVRLNGRVVSDFPTNNMIFGVAHYISAMTRYLTLYPGDMIWMGTDGATENMKPGDVVEVEISGIGTLRNPVVAGE